MRRWGWTPRRLPIPAEGPPPTPRIAPAAPPVPAVAQIDMAAPSQPDAPAQQSDPMAPPAPDAPARDDAATPDAGEPAQIVPRLQGAVARVLPAIETILGKLAAGPTQPREMERAARALAALTRTLRELNALLSQHSVPEDEGPATLDEYRQELARKIDAIIAARPKPPDDGAEPAGI